VNEYSSGIKDRWINNTEHKWTVVKEIFTSFTVSKFWMKNKPISFNACKSHEEEIDDIDRIMKPVP
jgi:hypothetical protein